MMLRYLVWIWDASDKASVVEAVELARRFDAPESWRRVLKQAGLEVHVTGVGSGTSEVYTLDNSGVILGKLFTRSEGESLDVPTKVLEGGVHTILGDDGRNLITGYWGRYVAFLCSPDQSLVRVIRAPCGSLPCLVVRLGRLHLYCSWIDDLALVGLKEWSVNWAVVSALLCGAQPDVRQTAIQGVSQVMGGECVSHHRAGRTERTFYWDPIRTPEISIDLQEGARLLRERVVDCVRAWRRCHSSAVQTLSGGLDSSAVATSQEPPSLQSTVFLNYFLPASDSDEREFARLVARYLDVELIEWQHDPFMSLEGLLRMRRVPFPAICLHSLELSEREAEFCEKTGATAIFGGHGGDQAFYSGPGAPCAGSYWEKHRGTLRGWSVVLDAAYRDRRSVWRVLKDIREQRRQPLSQLLGMQPGKHRTLLEEGIVEHIRRARPAWLHPLLRDPSDIDPARLVHAEHVLSPDDYYDTFRGPDYPDRISPILSQPVVELCLSLPRHLLISGGWNRAVARRAFQNHLPYEIVARRDKGSVRDHFRSILRCNTNLVRELLLDGELVRHHIINRAKTEIALAGDPTRIQTSTEELAIYVCTVGWLRQFQCAP